MLQRQLQAHIESLRAAGVEWVPLGPPLTAAPAGAFASPAEADDTPIAAPPVAPRAVAATAAPATPAAAVASVAPPAVPPSDDCCQALTLLANEVKTCTKCPGLASTRTQTVFAQGSMTAEICFIGEAPGADEDAQGLPFVGAAGQLLTKIIEACGMKREDVYICNVLKCRPPGNRTPLPDEVANCRGYLDRQLELVQPKFIVALGRTPATTLLGTTLSLARLRGTFHDYKGIPVMVTYHPAYLLPHRSPEKKREVWEDMKMLLAKMGREVPKKA